MNKEEIKRLIATIIERAEGYIVADEIFRLLSDVVDPGRTQETVRAYIRELVNDEKNLIGSSQYGFFKIRDADQLLQAINYLRHRIPPLQMRADNLQRAWDVQSNN
jgi:hypothetical protein